MHITAVVGQVKDGVPDDLAGPVEGDVPSPADAIDRYPPRIQHVSFIPAAAEREHRRMFKQQERILPFSLTPPPEQLLLPGQRSRILNQAGIDTLQFHHESEAVIVTSKDSFFCNSSFSIQRSSFL